jgi:hypothetical protein
LIPEFRDTVSGKIENYPVFPAAAPVNDEKLLLLPTAASESIE